MKKETCITERGGEKHVLRREEKKMIYEERNMYYGERRRT